MKTCYIRICAPNNEIRKARSLSNLIPYPDTTTLPLAPELVRNSCIQEQPIPHETPDQASHSAYLPHTFAGR